MEGGGPVAGKDQVAQVAADTPGNKRTPKQGVFAQRDTGSGTPRTSHSAPTSSNTPILDVETISLKIEEGEVRRSSPRLQASRIPSGDSKPEEEKKEEKKKKPRNKKDSDEDMGCLLSKLSLEETSVKEKSSSRTVLAYDQDMTLHKNIFTAHPERPKRISEPIKLLEECKLLSRVRTICSREATRDEALSVHTAEHWEFLTQLPTLSNRDLYRLGAEHDSVYLNNHTFRAAKLAAGSLMAITEEVLTDRAVNGVAVIRPPGHHCKAERPMGFCFLGNVPIACKFAINKYNVERILVVDWDVHHGNGTQDMFYEDEQVLYVSLHRYDHGWFYPGTGNPKQVGHFRGEGYNVNIAWNESQKGDGDYIRAFFDVILPIAWEYQPQLVFISAGFDSGLGDPLGNCRVTSECFGLLTYHLMSVCKGKVILALEGGYNLSTVANGIRACTSVLVGDFPEPITAEDSIPSPGGLESINVAAKHLSPYWNALAQHREPEVDEAVNNSEEKLTLSEMLRETNIPEIPISETASTENECTAEDLTSEERLMAEMAQSADAKEVVRVDPEVFAVHPKLWCEHLADHVRPAPPQLEATPSCNNCGDSSESWYCLACYQPMCSRYVNEHMLLHALDNTHLMTLSMSDLSVWCYGCDSYIHNEVLLDAKNKGHIAKFGSEPAGKIEFSQISENE